MSTSYTLGEHFDRFIAEQLKSGRYASASEVIRAGLRKLEDDEDLLRELRAMLQEGRDSGVAGTTEDVRARFKARSKAARKAKKQ